MNCSYRLGRLKRQQASDKLRFLHRSYMKVKQNGGLLLREKQARELSTCLTDHGIIQNHGTIERKNRSRIWSAATYFALFSWCNGGERGFQTPALDEASSTSAWVL